MPGAFDHDRLDVQVFARDVLFPFGAYRVVLLAAYVDVLNLRQFCERTDFGRQSGRAPGEHAGDPRREDFFEIERLFK